MATCVSNETWHAYLNGRDDGSFTIGQIVNGNFEGRYNGYLIRGSCSGKSIWFVRFGARTHRYNAAYLDDYHMRGNHAQTLKLKNPRVAFDDDWAAEKPTLPVSAKKRKAAKK